jgi:hypothetical protein
MSLPLLHSRTGARPSPSGAWQIAIGLAILISAAWFPIAPVVTAMAITALGATNATFARFQGSPALGPILLLHAVTYLSLYALLIGATLHAAAVASTAGLGVGRSLDLAVSLLPMAIALQRMGGMLFRRSG